MVILGKYTVHGSYMGIPFIYTYHMLSYYFIVPQQLLHDTWMLCIKAYHIYSMEPLWIPGSCQNFLPFVYRKTDGCAVQWLGSSFGVCETCVDIHSPWDFFPIGFLWKCYIYLYMNGWFRLVNGRHINIPDSSHGSFGIWPQETSVLAMGKENSRDTACVSWIFFVPRTVQWLYKANPPKKKTSVHDYQSAGSCWNMLKPLILDPFYHFDSSPWNHQHFRTNFLNPSPSR